MRTWLGFLPNSINCCLRGMKQWVTHWRKSCVLSSHSQSALPPMVSSQSFWLCITLTNALPPCLLLFSSTLSAAAYTWLGFPTPPLLHSSARFILRPFPSLRKGSSVLALHQKTGEPCSPVEPCKRHICKVFVEGKRRFRAGPTSRKQSWVYCFLPLDYISSKIRTKFIHRLLLTQAWCRSISGRFMHNIVWKLHEQVPTASSASLTQVTKLHLWNVREILMTMG